MKPGYQAAAIILLQQWLGGVGEVGGASGNFKSSSHHQPCVFCSGYPQPTSGSQSVSKGTTYMLIHQIVTRKGTIYWLLILPGTEKSCKDYPDFIDKDTEAQKK